MDTIAAFGLVALVLVCIAVIITAMLMDHGYQVSMLRMQGEFELQLASRPTFSEVDDLQGALTTSRMAHEQALLKILRAGEVFGSEFSVDHSAGWGNADAEADRRTDTFNNVLEFLNCIADCREAGRTVWYTRVGSLVLSN
jgi:hypothetical protein